MKIIELREYQLIKGKTAQWLKVMSEDILPHQRSKGMIILATTLHTGEDGFDYFIWLREFADEATRQCVYEATYDEVWNEVIMPKTQGLVNKEASRIRILEPLDL